MVVAAYPNVTAQLDAALAHAPLRGVGGVTTIVAWSAIEPAAGRYRFEGLELTIALAERRGLPVQVAIMAGVGTPHWLFGRVGRGMSGAQRMDLVWAPWHGQAGFCVPVVMAPPWDGLFLQRFADVQRAVANHFGPRIAAVRLTGMNCGSEELHMTSQTPADIRYLPCMIDNMAEWRRVGLTQERLDWAWAELVEIFRRAYPTQIACVAYIPSGHSGDNRGGGALPGPHGTSERFVEAAAAAFRGRFVLQYSFIPPTLDGRRNAQDAAAAQAHRMGVPLSGQTNFYFSREGGGAGCTGKKYIDPGRCTDATFGQMLALGLEYRPLWIEIFPSDAVEFPGAVARAAAQF